MRKTNLIVSLAAFAAAMVAAPASAQFYIGGGIGSGKATDTSGSGVIGNVPYSVSGGDDHKTTWQINGGYQFTPVWGIEVQYTDLNKRNGTVRFGAPVNTTSSLSDVKAHQWGISGTGTMPFTDKWFGRGKLGVSSNHIDSASACAGGVCYNTGSNSHTGVLVGLGVGYKWTQNFSTRLEYEYFGKFETSNGQSSGNGNNIGVRLQYTF